MVEKTNKTYLVSGGEPSRRRRAINNIKKTIFEDEGFALRAVTLYAAEVGLDSFKDLVFTLSFQKKKVILIKDFTGLPKDLRKFLFGSLKKVLKYNYLIFDSELPYSLLAKNKKIISDNLFNFILKESIKYQGKTALAELSVDDFRKELYKNNLNSCLFILEELLSSKGKGKTAATQILGLIIAKFSYLRKSNKKEELFNQLWQADRALKQSNLDIRLLMERLLVKLFA
ncbi:MAG: hypothetical protein K9L95_03865 [Candidatus Omnitrophica bacterium]|nr:hypothetical protein [Candidatus Omnitrophota bacterium]MCF7878588.1 hypothetical protein [Candidatus Omnitrophota bacterium]MCF7892854.1 hypothetical protein [Candidatus Omnitrophota bacterium]